MDKLFLAHVLLAFFIAGSWIACSSLVAEKLGSKVGGLIANLPANLLISLLFVTFVRDVNYVTEAVLAVPAGLINTTIFLLVFVACLRWGLLAASSVSLLTWFVIALALDYMGQINLVLGILCYVVFLVLVVIALERLLPDTAVTALKKQYSKSQIAGRAVFSGSVVATVVVISKFSPPYFTGIFATFPAMLFTTMFILARSQGPGFARSVGKVLVLTTSNLLIYGLAVYITYPHFGVVYGTLIAYLASVAWVFSLYPVVKRLA